MLKHRPQPPRHRAPTEGAGVRVVRASGVAIRNGLMLSSLAVAATGTVVTGGVMLGDAAAADPGAAAAAAPAAAGPAEAGSQAGAVPDAGAASEAGDDSRAGAAGEAEAESGDSARADLRSTTDPAKAAVLAAPSSPAVVRTEDLSEGDPRLIARLLMPEFGFSDDQFSCLDSLYVSESGWRTDADNPTSSAYGIPQALTQLHDLPPGYMTSAEVQIRWGLEYIQDSYGTPCSAWTFKKKHNWY